jgi:hypothetical protein
LLDGRLLKEEASQVAVERIGAPVRMLARSRNGRKSEAALAGVESRADRGAAASTGSR